MKNYLAAFLQKDSDLLHRVADGGGGRAFDESKVKRDEGGQFAKKDANPISEDMQKKLTEAFIEEFGTDVVGQDFDSYVSSLPAEQVDEVWAKIEEITKRVTGGEMKHHGIRGMKWGIRRTDAQLAKDTAKRKASGEDITPTKKAEAALKSTGPETSQQRYARLTGEAKGGGQKSWSDDDLKFYNSRTEALAKVNKMFEQQPGWLSTTSKKVLQNAAQRTMQDVANGVTNKYITTRLLDALNDKAATTAKK